MNQTLAQLLYALVNVLAFAIVVRSILSWFPMRPGNPVANFLFAVTEPILLPLRRIIPRFGMIDLTPMVAILVLFALSSWIGTYT